MASDRTSRAPHEQYRLADFPVDDAWVRKNNESLAEVRRLQWSAGILGVVVLAAGTGMLLYSGLEPWGWIIAALAGVFAIGCLAMIGYIPRKMGSMAHTYATSELVPAIVAEVRPRGLTLLALVDRAVDRSAGSLPALAVRSCEKIPGHDVRVGTRVPCVAVVGNRSARGGDNLYQFISPMPVAWATPDATVLRRLTKEIPAGEWETLRQNLDRVGEVSASPANLVPLD
ncbi:MULTISPECIES: DUF3239 domain-containing protein [Dietzia]|uniref:DUF3239 domain-containing protein n=1 Tax=Dietzia TaxID=37914 RepID=UPI0015FAB412|nr:MULTISPECIES: DUF3239 domain-containing protein [Dietzia]MBB1056317.1 DUF3239 domain-containing protein [Dietzia sp. B19]MBC7296831.1 DUF3239 domain-containing protein [Dietzia sp.]MCT1517135.1 DUF3239 domain-containing protein [Dietzia cercidiphylli]